MTVKSPPRKTILGNTVVDVFDDSGKKKGEIITKDGFIGKSSSYKDLRSDSYTGSYGKPSDWLKTAQWVTGIAAAFGFMLVLTETAFGRVVGAGPVATIFVSGFIGFVVGRNILYIWGGMLMLVLIAAAGVGTLALLAALYWILSN